MVVEIKIFNRTNFYIVMKKVYHLLSVALLGAMALTSCEEDKIVNENSGGGNETDKNLTDYSFIASIKQSAPLGRSNLQNGVYTWNKGDAVTLWNRNFGAGYDFSITPGYNDNQPDKSAEFTGKAAVENGHKLIAVFPRKEAKTFNDLATFSMPETSTQTGNAAELAATTYMVAIGDVIDNKIPALTFSPLTALIQFGLKNTSDRELKIRYITLESDDDVFPAELKIDEDGVLQSLSGMRNKLTLDMSGQALAQNETLNGYLNILPTTYGDTRLMKSTTELNITVSVLNNEVEQDIILLKKVKVKDHEVSRPVVSEVTEVLKLAEMARETGGLLYIVHVSCGTTVKRLKECFSKELKSKQIILESCPHYYLFNSEIFPLCVKEEEVTTTKRLLGYFSFILFI